jgi:hypothetical protein
VASDFALDTLVRQPALLAQLAAPGCPPIPAPVLDPLQPSDWPAQLRRWRTAMSTRLIWRDLAGLDDVAQTLAGATTLAEDCLRLALDALQQEFAQRHGVVRDGEGAAAAGGVRLGKPAAASSTSVPISTWSTPTPGGESDGPARWPPRSISPASASAWPSCWTKPPSMASATASTCACARSAAPVASRCRSRRWISTSSAKAATGSAMRG